MLRKNPCEQAEVLPDLRRLVLCDAGDDLDRMSREESVKA
jgi:hypothetical protein